MFCKKCGAEIPEGKKYCADCGTAADSNGKGTKIALIVVSCVAVAAIICAAVLGIKAMLGNGQTAVAPQPSETVSTKPATTVPTTVKPTATPTTAPTTVPATQAPTTQKQTKPNTTKPKPTEPPSDCPFDIYMIAAAGLETIYNYVAAPSSVTIEKIAYDPDMDADEYMELEVQIYCSYVNKTGGLNSLICHVSLMNIEPPDGIQEAAYQLDDSLYAACYVVDEPSSTSVISSYKKMDINKVIAAHDKENWGSRKVFYMSDYT